MSITTENTFELAIVESLLSRGEYLRGDASAYNRDLGLFTVDLINFLKTTQLKRWERLAAIHGDEIEKRILQRVYKELDLRGALDVIRNGFVDYGVRFQMAFFQPASGMNPEALSLYRQNYLKVYRQVFYSNDNRNSVDVILALNGMPVATLELKNQFTGQNVNDALRQYSATRDQRELLFNFNKRSLVHFAVDQEEIYMTTKVDGTKTIWLPFNQGNNKGKGNPPNANGYRTSYLWEYILAKDSWLDIIQRFIHLQSEEFVLDDVIHRKERLIFPRYHQLDVVRKIKSDVLTNGAGRNYLVQHSAGSGKSNSIAWLAYTLSSLHDANNGRIFDSVVVVTDRRVLDQQLQNTIFQFEHKTGVVQKIDKNSEQLRAALSYGRNIIITTLQKFPFVVDEAGTFPHRKYAVIVDEAHSSQGGETSRKMKATLGVSNQDEHEDEDEDFTLDDLVSDEIRRSAISRGQQDHVSFFAFTATPKFRTLKIFGHEDAQGKPQAFHLYSMRQAIEEGFIMDVLQNYTTYETYFKLAKRIEEDPKLSKRKAAKAINRFVALHPHSISQKTAIIIEHFRDIVAKKIGGKAKGMLVTGSRELAIRYYKDFQYYISENGYSHELKILVAFSGNVTYEDFPDGVSEPDLTGYSEYELPKTFEKDEYKILIVADKYQTGYDQPLLHTMYIDKKLFGVKAVQTLSRLNRTCPGKEDTFILDFANDRERIFKSFKPYYETTAIKEETDVNHLYDLKNRLDGLQICWQKEVDEFANAYFDPTIRVEQIKNQRLLYAFTDPAVDRFRKLDSPQQEQFRKGLRAWTNLYAFLSQIMPFIDVEFEKYYAYAKLLLTRLPKKELGEILQIVDEVALEYYRLQKIKEGAIELRKGEQEDLQGVTEAGLLRPKEEEVQLSEIIQILNQRFGTEFDEADKLFFDQIEIELLQQSTLESQAHANKLDTFKYAFEDIFTGILVDRMDQNQDIFEKILEDKSFGNLVKDWMMRRVYNKFNQKENQ